MNLDCLLGGGCGGGKNWNEVRMHTRLLGGRNGLCLGGRTLFRFLQFFSCSCVFVRLLGGWVGGGFVSWDG